MKQTLLAVLIRPGLGLVMFGSAAWLALQLERFIPPGKLKDALYKRYE